MPGPRPARGVLVIGVALPLLALLAAVPVPWGWGLSYLDITIALVFYWVSASSDLLRWHPCLPRR